MNSMQKALAMGAVFLMIGVTNAGADGFLRFAAVLKGANGSPTAPSKGRGILQAEVDNEAGVLTYTASYSGLTGPVTAAGFSDGTALRGQFTVAAPIDGTTTIHGTAHLTARQVGELNDARFIFQIATSANPNGEIEGRVRRDN